MKLLIQFILMGASVALAAYFLPGVEVASFWWAIIVAVAIALLNATVGTILRILTLPLNRLTLGLVGGIISILMILLASSLLEGFHVGGILNAILFALIVAFIDALFGTITD